VIQNQKSKKIENTRYFIELNLSKFLFKRGYPIKNLFFLLFVVNIEIKILIIFKETTNI